MRIALLLLLALATTAAAQTVAIVGATIHTLGPLGTIDAGVVLIEDGVIVALGDELAIPEDAQRIDGSGQVVTPGLFDAHTYLGLTEIDLVEESVDAQQRGSRYTAAFDVTAAINPRSTLIPVNRIEGVTHAMVAPRPAWEEANLISGLGAVIHLGGAQDYVVRPRAALFAQLGETGAHLTDGSRAAALLALREALEDARDYDRHRGAYEDRRRREYSIGRYDLEALQAVLERDIPLVVRVNRASDIERLLDLAARERIEVVVDGGAEAWLVADRLAAAGVAVILDPTRNLPESFSALNASLASAARLHAAGVRVAFTLSDSHNSRNIRQLAGNAVANGLPWEQALRAITVEPARIYGVADAGALEVGNPASLVLWDGDPLEVTTFATQVFIAGRAVSMHSRQTLLRDRYRRLDPDLPHAYQNP